MTEEKVSPLRARMIEDMRIKGLGDKAQKSHVRAVRELAAFLRRSPDTATLDDLRAYQLYLTDAGTSPSAFNSRINGLRFFFGTTCRRGDLQAAIKFRRQPRKLPVVFSVEEIAALLQAAPGPGLKYRAALGLVDGAGLRASEVCRLKIMDIVPQARLRYDSDRMLIHVEYPSRQIASCQKHAFSETQSPVGRRAGERKIAKPCSRRVC